MVRDSILIDKLVADLHFHNYLFVMEGDNIFTESNATIDKLQSILKSFGLDQVINAHTDFYHGGSVIIKDKIDYLNTYLDDVLIDHFFRTYSFKEIVFPKGFCYEQITPNGVIHPRKDIFLNLNDIYDRCTFANNIWRLFGVCKSRLAELFPGNQYIGSHFFNEKLFGLHAWCRVLINGKLVYSIPLDQFTDKYYPGKALVRSPLRGKCIKEFVRFICGECVHDYYNSISISTIMSLHKFEHDFSKICKSNIFGEYTIQDILLIYALLTDKFLLDEDSFLLPLCFCMKTEIEDNVFLKDFIRFEKSNLSVKSVEPFIKSKDVYLRFASETNSKAFTFKEINDVLCEVQLFGKPSTKLVRHSNTMPLPYLYQSLNKTA